SHGGHAVQQFNADSVLGGEVHVVLAHGFKSDGHAAGSGTGDAGKQVDHDEFGDQRVAGTDAHEGFLNGGEAGQAGDDVAVAHFRSGVHDGEQRTDGTGVEAGHQVAAHLELTGGDQDTG